MFMIEKCFEYDFDFFCELIRGLNMNLIPYALNTTFKG